MIRERIYSVDLFAGGGGASKGIEMATGYSPTVAINHNADALLMHATNHPGTMHLCESVFDVQPFRPRGREIDLLWLSPDCTHHSRAKGGKPRDNDMRGLAWIGVHWAAEVRPRVICLENVPEFVDWGPLYSDDYPVPELRNRPIPEQKGETFYKFVEELEDLGYDIEWRTLVCADYGAPTIRKRLFLIARCDGEPIYWPKPTHGPNAGQEWGTAAQCIDWDIPCPSIFLSKEEGRAIGVRRPLADKTLARIAEGMKRYVFESADPFLLNLTHGGRLEPLSEPFRAITAAHRGEKALVAPTLIQTGYGERKGQAPRALDLQKPLGTVVAGGVKHALVSAFLAKHYGGVVGQGMRKPLGTITARDHHSLVTAFLTKFYGSSRHGQGLQLPLPTVTATGQHLGLVAAFLTKYYGAAHNGQGLHGPLHTVVSKDRFGLVTVAIGGEQYTVVDIGMRMLTPRELARGQGFPDDYVLTGNTTSQVARIGNSVPPQVVRAIVDAQFRRRPYTASRAFRAA